MATYDLTHLTQPENQDVMGPIQDDEALVLYSIIRTMRLKRIVELGGLNGYSATNFIKALNNDGILYTVDYDDCPIVSNNHKLIKKDIGVVNKDDFDNTPIDMIFFDCHAYDASLKCFITLSEQGIITDDTILTLHDTNLYPNGFMHQPTERHLVNLFTTLGYHVFNLHTKPEVHNDNLPNRHGLTICQKYKILQDGFL
jgi:predicted O-methyltransferase YrrM